MDELETEAVPMESDAAAAEDVADPGPKKDQIGVDLGDGTYGYVDVPEGYGPRERRINYGGRNHEHVDTDKDGIWLYRAM